MLVQEFDAYDTTDWWSSKDYGVTENPVYPVTEFAPVFTQATCGAKATVTIPLKEGLVYRDADSTLIPQDDVYELEDGESVTIFAFEEPNFIVPVGEVTEWTLTSIAPTDCNPVGPVTPVEPVVPVTPVDPGQGTVVNKTVTVNKVTVNTPKAERGYPDKLPVTGADSAMMAGLSVVFLLAGAAFVTRNRFRRQN